jgi:hypothetical protein
VTGSEAAPGRVSGVMAPFAAQSLLAGVAVGFAKPAEVCLILDLRCFSWFTSMCCVVCCAPVGRCVCCLSVSCHIFFIFHLYTIPRV